MQSQKLQVGRRIFRSARVRFVELLRQVVSDELALPVEHMRRYFLPAWCLHDREIMKALFCRASELMHSELDTWPICAPIIFSQTKLLVAELRQQLEKRWLWDEVISNCQSNTRWRLLVQELQDRFAKTSITHEAQLCLVGITDLLISSI